MCNPVLYDPSRAQQVKRHLVNILQLCSPSAVLMIIKDGKGGIFVQCREYPPGKGLLELWAKH